MPRPIPLRTEGRELTSSVPVSSVQGQGPSTLTRTVLLFAYQIAGFVVSVASASLSILVSKVGDLPADGGTAWQEFGGILLLMPLGWLMFSFVHPSGWIYWAGCIATVTFRRLWSLAFAIVGGAIFGWLWPLAYFRIMSV